MSKLLLVLSVFVAFDLFAASSNSQIAVPTFHVVCNCKAPSATGVYGWLYYFNGTLEVDGTSYWKRRNDGFEKYLAPAERNAGTYGSAASAQAKADEINKLSESNDSRKNTNAVTCEGIEAIGLEVQHKPVRQAVKRGEMDFEKDLSIFFQSRPPDDDRFMRLVYDAGKERVKETGHLRHCMVMEEKDGKAVDFGFERVEKPVPPPPHPDAKTETKRSSTGRGFLRGKRHF